MSILLLKLIVEWEFGMTFTFSKYFFPFMAFSTFTCAKCFMNYATTALTSERNTTSYCSKWQVYLNLSATGVEGDDSDDVTAVGVGLEAACCVAGIIKLEMIHTNSR